MNPPKVGLFIRAMPGLVSVGLFFGVIHLLRELLWWSVANGVIDISTSVGAAFVFHDAGFITFVVALLIAGGVGSFLDSRLVEPFRARRKQELQRELAALDRINNPLLHDNHLRDP